MLRQILITTAMLTLFSLIGTLMVAVTHVTTRPQVEANERQALLQQLEAIMPRERFDNDIVQDTSQVTDAQLLGTPKPVTVYRARRHGQPVGAVIAAIAPDGYSGPIRLLVGIHQDGTLAGVRVVAHKETPGLGDPIEEGRSDWITRFTGRSLINPDEAGWRVKRDGGVFDQFTGATITPRAVVKAVHQSLIYFKHNRERLFANPPPAAAGGNQHPE